VVCCCLMSPPAPFLVPPGVPAPHLVVAGSDRGKVLDSDSSCSSQPGTRQKLLVSSWC
jgi:hypothetical protein